MFSEYGFQKRLVKASFGEVDQDTLTSFKLALPLWEVKEEPLLLYQMLLGLLKNLDKGKYRYRGYIYNKTGESLELSERVMLAFLVDRYPDYHLDYLRRVYNRKHAVLSVKPLVDYSIRSESESSDEEDKGFVMGDDEVLARSSGTLSDDSRGFRPRKRTVSSSEDELPPRRRRCGVIDD